MDPLASNCPLCGGPNGCAIAAGAAADSPCWCHAVVFSPEVLAQVPEPQRGQVCICARCAASFVGTRGAVPGGAVDAQ